MALVEPGQAPVSVARTARRLAPAVGQALLELVLVALLFELYRFGRLLARGEEAAAYANAVDVHRLERLLHLPSEAAVQGLVPSDTLLHLANLYYFSVHFPTMVAFLVYGYLFRPRWEYVWARNLLIALTSAALVVHIVYPLAPPRMFPQWGFVDTMAALGPDAYAGASGDLANQFAAMPSLHAGWNLLIGLAIVTAARRPLLKLVGVLLPMGMVAAVVLTANHYILDVLAGTALTSVCWILVPHIGPAARRARIWMVQRVPLRRRASMIG